MLSVTLVTERDRELMQLWCVARFYLDKAQGLKSEFRTFAEIGDALKTDPTKGKNARALALGAHLDSAAIRLFSIEERINKGFADGLYHLGGRDNQRIHVYLRDSTAHAESHRRGKIRSKVLGNLPVNEALSLVEKVGERLWKELRNLPWLRSGCQKLIPLLHSQSSR